MIATYHVEHGKASFLDFLCIKFNEQFPINFDMLIAFEKINEQLY